MSQPAIQPWLEQTALARGGVEAAIVVLADHQQPGAAAHWPVNRPPDQDLLAAAQAVQAGSARQQTDPQPDPHIVTGPVRSNGKVVGTLAMRLLEPAPARPKNPDQAAVPAANDPAAGPSAAPRRDAVSQLPLVKDEDTTLKLVQTTLEQPGFNRAAMALATELAQAFACDRVLVGMVVRRFARVRGISHGARLAPESSLARTAGAAMDEALDQGACIHYPQHPDDQPRITLAHAELSHLGAGTNVLTVPLFHGGRPVGALTFERPQSERFDARAVQRVEAVGAALAPLLQLKFDNERTTLQRLRHSWDTRAAGGSGAGRLSLVTGATVGAAALAALLASHWNYQINTTTRIEGQVQRAVVAPIDGFLKSALVRAGDSVREGQVLAELSDEELRLERQRLETEIARHLNTYADAQAKADRTQLVVADARVAETRAQLALVDQQLSRTRMVAPFDALVIKGDLSQMLGAPVKRGEVLLTLTPSREFRVMLDIDERDVALVQPGTRGAVTLSALPDRSFGLVVERVMPVAKVDGGRNLFEAEARMDTDADVSALRPGLQGVTRLEVGERTLFWQLSHRSIDWVRLQWWSWMG